MVTRYIPDRGDIIYTNFDPKAGHEQAGFRPAIVLTPLNYNGQCGLVCLCPITKQRKGYPFEVELRGTTKTKGVVLVNQIRTFDWLARDANFVEKVTDMQVLDEINGKLAALLKLEH